MVLIRVALVGLAVGVATSAFATDDRCQVEGVRTVYEGHLQAIRDRARGEIFAARRGRLRTADAAPTGPASDPLQITGGLSDDKTTVKVRVARSFAKAFATADVTGSIASGAVKDVNFLDGLEVSNNWSLRPRFMWTSWDKAIPDATIAKAVCDRTIQLIESRAANPREELIRTWTPPDPDDPSGSIVFAVAFEAGRSSFDFADDQAGFVKATASHEAHALAVTGGYITPLAGRKDGPLLAFLINYQRKHAHTSAGSKTTICRATSAPGVSDCEQLVKGAPVPADVNQLQLDLRFWPAAIAVSPGVRVTRTFETVVTPAVTTYEVPTYFVRQKPESGMDFTAGVTAGYRDNGTKKGAFVSLLLGTLVSRPQPKPEEQKP